MIRVGGLLVALVAVAATLGHQFLTTAESTASPFTPLAVSASSSVYASPVSVPTGEHRPQVGGGGGGAADRVPVFNDQVPAVTKLSEDLLDALRQAATDAKADGVEFTVNSGWRSAEYQDQLLRDAISLYGSKKEAARWVATSRTSAHVSGDAVDIGPAAATNWLSENGADYGLCQIYRNEPWHYELRPDAAEGGCPKIYADPTKDPRMQG